MLGRTRTVLALLLALGLVAGLAAGAGPGDEAAVENGDHDHSDGSDDGNFLPGPSPVLVGALVGAAAAALGHRKR